jgi:hypothetical protein
VTDSVGECARLCELSCFEVCETSLLERRIVDIVGRQIWHEGVGNLVLLRREVGFISIWPRAASLWPYYDVFC